MDAVKFIEERRRMCKMHRRCHGCEALLDNYSCVFSVTGDVAPIKQVEFLEEWSAAHPLKTRQSVFLGQYPNAAIRNDGFVNIDPCDIDKKVRESAGCGGVGCINCRREFWMQEVE